MDGCKDRESDLHSLINRAFHELLHAIARAELFRAGNQKGLIDRVNDAGLGNTFNLVRDSLHKDLCLTLARLFDERDDSLSFGVLLTRSGYIRPVDPASLDRAIELNQMARSDPEKAGLRELRNRVLAHTDITGRGHTAKYGDEMRVLELAIDLHTAIAKAFGSHYDFRMAMNDWADQSERFWEALVSTK